MYTICGDFVLFNVVMKIKIQQQFQDTQCNKSLEKTEVQSGIDNPERQTLFNIIHTTRIKQSKQNDNTENLKDEQQEPHLKAGV